MAEKFDPYHKWLGIPPEEQPADHYRLLGIGQFENDRDVIEGAADRQMAHVQKHKLGAHSAASQRILNELAAAKITLLNPAKRSAYDRSLRATPAPAKAMSTPAAAADALDFVARDRTTASTPSRREGTVPRKRSRQEKKIPKLGLFIAPAMLVAAGVVGIVAWRLSGSTAPPKPAKLVATKAAKSPKSDAAQFPAVAPSRVPGTATDVQSSGSGAQQPSAVRPVLRPPAPPAPATIANGAASSPMAVKQQLSAVKALQETTEQGSTKCVAISPDGRWVFWSGQFQNASNQTNSFWDLRDEIPMRQLGTKEPIQKAAFTADGKQLITVTFSEANILELPSMVLVHRTPLPTKLGDRLALASDGSSLGTFQNKEYVAAVYDSQSGELVYRATDLRANIGALSVSPGGKFAFVGGKSFDPQENGGVFNKVYDLQAKNEVPVDFALSSYAFVNTFSDDGILAIFSHEKREIQLWDIPRRTLRQTLPNHLATSCLTFTPDGNRLLCAITGGAMRLWDVTTREVLAEFNDPRASVAAAALQIAADGRTVVSADQKGGVFVWSLTAADGIRSPAAASPATASVGPQPSPSLVPPPRIVKPGAGGALAANKKYAAVEVLQEAHEHRSTQSAAISPDGNWLFWSGAMNVPGPKGFAATFSNILWDLRDGTQSSVLPGEKLLFAAVFTADGKHLITMKRSGTTTWEFPTLNEMRTTTFPVKDGLMGGDFALSTDGSLQARFENDRHSAVFVDSQSGAEVFRTPEMPLLNGTKLSLSPDGKLAFVGGEILEGRKTLGYYNQIYDLTTKQALTIDFKRPESVARDAAFADHDTLKMLSHDRTEIQFWDIPRQMLRMTLPRDGSTGGLMAFTADGKRMLRAAHNTPIKLWDLSTRQVLEQFASPPGGNPSVLKITPDGRRVLYACDQGSVVLFSLKSAGGLETPTAPAGPVGTNPPAVANRPAANPPDANEPVRPVASLQRSRTFTKCVAISPDGKFVFWSGKGEGPLGAENPDNFLWDLRGKEPNALKAPISPEKAVFTADGKHLFMLTTSEAVALDVTTMRVVASSRLPFVGLRNMLAVAPDASCFGIYASREHTLAVHDSQTGALLFQANDMLGTGHDLSLSAGRKYAYVAIVLIENNKAAGFVQKLFDLQAKRELPTDLERPRLAYCNAFSPRGVFALDSAEGRNVQIWNIDRKKLNPPLNTNGSGIFMAFTPDGDKLLTAHSGGKMKLWNVATGELLMHYQDPSNQANFGALQISGDGRTAVTAEQSGGVRLWSLFGDAPLPVAAAPVNPGMPAANLTPVAAGAEPPVTAAAGARLDMPDDAARQEARKLIKDIYRDEYAKAKKPADKLALAEKLQNQATQAQAPVEKFVLLAEARDLACEAGDATTFFKSLAALDEAFVVDLTEMALAGGNSLVEKLAPKTRYDLATGLLPLVDRALRDDQYDAAARLLELALSSARKAKDGALVKQIIERKSNVLELRKQESEINAARETLAKSADDPTANLAMGKFYCLLKDDWQRGLRLLARSGDNPLQELAAQEIADPKTPTERMKLADGWYTLSQAASGNEKTKYLFRAAQWYRKVLPELTGITLLKVQKRLEELDGTSAR